MDSVAVLLLAITMLIVMLVLRIPLWIVFFVTAFTTALIAGGPSLLANIIWTTTTDPTTIDLVTIMFLIAVLVGNYRETGFIDKLGEELVAFFKKPVLSATLVPAILGLLPVPGGALMSAPIVDKVGDYMELDNVRKVFVNVWYRHIIFMIYPLSTLLILTATLTNTSIWVLITRQAPIALFMFVIGFIIGFPMLRSKSKTRTSYSVGSANKKILLKVFSPIIVAITIAVSTSRFLDYKLPLPINRVSMVLGVSMGIILLYLLSRIPRHKFMRTFYSKSTIELVLVGYGSMLLRGVFLSISVEDLASYIPGYINPLAVALMLPLFFSLVAGVPTSGIVLSIPIIQEVCSITPGIASMIYVSAFIGYLGSPLHLCYIYTAQYLNTPLMKTYKYMAPACMITLLFTFFLNAFYP
ncbi:DUF401 family protein [Desulfurococcaceae archaeon MEX13E-LK6-19]|nr:DUF401 family protein [Desulfurococcaceae archaeon MEX13E-LK6-19]